MRTLIGATDVDWEFPDKVSVPVPILLIALKLSPLKEPAKVLFELTPFTWPICRIAVERLTVPVPVRLAIDVVVGGAVNRIEFESNWSGELATVLPGFMNASNP